MSNAFRKSSGRRSGQRFDARYGVVTEALIFLGELDPAAIGAAIDDATHYEPTPLGEFEQLLATLSGPLKETSFVDVGAGMGRVVLLASEHPFRQVIGVEVSPALCETARDNAVRWRRIREDIACKDIRIVCKDAAAFRFPPGALVVYLYNPFGEATVAHIAERLAAQSTGPVDVLYHTPVHRRVFDEDPRYRQTADLGFGAAYRLN